MTIPKEVLAAADRFVIPQTNRLRLIRFVEAWVEHSPDEAFSPDFDGWSINWTIPETA